MVNRLVALWLMLLWGGMAMASDGPAELPPPDFVSRQYIDSTGCVFYRDDTGQWAARLNNDDSKVCGYPPTLSARRLSPDGAASLFTPTHSEPAREMQIEQALAGLVIPNLQTGELVGDRTKFSPRPDMGPEPSSIVPLRELQAEIAHQGEVRAQMNGMLQPNRSLCRLLGLDTQKGGQTGVMPGADPTQGFCDSIPRDDLARLAFTRPANLPVPADAERTVAVDASPNKPDDVRAAARVATQREGHPPSKDKAASVTATGPSPVRAAGRKPHSSTAQSRERPAASDTAGRTVSGQPKGPWISGIPAGTRFIFIGTYRNGPELDAILRRLSRMGMPIVRQISPVPAQGSTQVILVGPFDSRQSIVHAFDRLRRAGLPAAPR